MGFITERTDIPYKEITAIRFAPVQYKVVNSTTGKTSAYYLNEIKQIIDGELCLSDAEQNILVKCFMQELYDKGMQSLKEVDLTNKVLICNREQAELYGFFKGEEGRQCLT